MDRQAAAKRKPRTSDIWLERRFASPYYKFKAQAFNAFRTAQTRGLEFEYGMFQIGRRPLGPS